MTEHVGLILVHGIGQQKRFAHLDSEIRGIIDGLKRRKSARISVEILGNNAATYNAEQDTWAAGPNPSARITIVESGKTTEICVHEVWWADINEPYSLAKQIRFWFWGLSVWAFPRSTSRPDLPGLRDAMAIPETPNSKWRNKLFVRFQLYSVGVFFLVAAFSLGAAIFLVKRLFGYEAPNTVQVLVNYISGVKLYNQSTRQGSGMLPNPHGFLDTLDDPPRVSIRRRMIETIAGVASQNDYDRWYILAHSLGSVVAFNGIMEYGQAFANYLHQSTWDDLKQRGMAGSQRAGTDWIEDPPGVMSPTRPVWLKNDDLVYRDKIFEKFRGLLTYGSPLGKFAELWPARVPVNSVEPIFKPATEWINVYDGRDPVSGPMLAFESDELRKKGVTPRHCPSMQGFAYKASQVLLLSHIRYLTLRDESSIQFADMVADWLLTGGKFVPPAEQGRWHEMKTYRSRVRVSWIWWISVFLVASVLGTISAMALLDLLTAFWNNGGRWTENFISWLGG